MSIVRFSPPKSIIPPWLLALLPISLLSNILMLLLDLRINNEHTAFSKIIMLKRAIPTIEESFTDYNNFIGSNYKPWHRKFHP